MEDMQGRIALLAEVCIDLRVQRARPQHMYLDGEDVERRIRQVSHVRLEVSAIPEVRAFLMEMQRDLARASECHHGRTGHRYRGSA